MRVALRIGSPGDLLAPWRVRVFVGGTSVSDAVTVDVQLTPNVNALKFVINRRLTQGRSQTFRTPAEAASSPLASALLAIAGVVQVFCLNDFITITRDPSAPWDAIAPQVEEVIRRHFASEGS